MSHQTEWRELFKEKFMSGSYLDVPEDNPYVILAFITTLIAEERLKVNAELYKQGKFDERMKVVEILKNMKPILWSNDPNRYLENVARYNTIDEALLAINIQES